MSRSHGPPLLPGVKLLQPVHRCASDTVGTIPGCLLGAILGSGALEELPKYVFPHIQSIQMSLCKTLVCCKKVEVFFFVVSFPCE